MHRKGISKEVIAKAINKKESTVVNILQQSRHYRAITQKRKKQSTYNKNEILNKARSKMFRLESEFRDYAASEMAKVFDFVQTEVGIPKTKRRIDVVVTHGLWRFGIELKNGNRTARLDQALGQAIIKCHALGGLIPVCCIPDDIVADKVFIDGCKHAGVIAGRLCECINEIKIKCCI
jgi:transposase